MSFKVGSCPAACLPGCLAAWAWRPGGLAAWAWRPGPGLQDGQSSWPHCRALHAGLWGWQPGWQPGHAPRRVGCGRLLLWESRRHATALQHSSNPLLQRAQHPCPLPLPLLLLHLPPPRSTTMPSRCRRRWAQTWLRPSPPSTCRCWGWWPSCTRACRRTRRAGPTCWRGSSLGERAAGAGVLVLVCWCWCRLPAARASYWCRLLVLVLDAAVLHLPGQQLHCGGADAAACGWCRRRWHDERVQGLYTIRTAEELIWGYEVGRLLGRAAALAASLAAEPPGC